MTANERKARARERARRYYEQNREAVLAQQRDRRAADPEKIRALERERYTRHPAKKLSASKRWRTANPQKQKEYARRYYERNRARVLGQARTWAADHPEEAQEIKRRWRERNPEQLREAARRWKREHPAEHRADWRRWANRHPEKARANRRRNGERYATRKLGAFIEDVDPATVYEMHGGRCGICGEFVNESDAQVDHVVPLARGGKHGYINVQPAHQSCNARKGARLQEELAA